MSQELFKAVSINPDSEKWEASVKRENELYSRPHEIRSEFYRDYGRIIHSQPYRRLKHKTQVFFATDNDHICTRIEHVNHVASVSYSIAKYLGLNTELTTAIAVGHDIGHAPFGHEGETRLKALAKDAGIQFWHEKNGVYVCDNIATVIDDKGSHSNLNLTYAVRDGIISHCGEVDENAIKPRKEIFDLNEIEKKNEHDPFTWEACMVKIADKIAYLGRDIEDALELKVLDFKELLKLRRIVENNHNLRTINNTTLMNGFISDLCKNSTPQTGIRLSEEYLKIINKVKEFNYEYIYKHRRINYFKRYSGVLIETLHEFISSYYKGKDTTKALTKDLSRFPILLSSFREWLYKYSDADLKKRKTLKAGNRIIYKLENEVDFKRAVIDYIAGMTDNFAIKTYHEIIKF